MKKIITLIALAALFFTSCGNDEKEKNTTLQPIAVKLSGNANSNSSSPYVTASGKIESEKQCQS